MKAAHRSKALARFAMGASLALTAVAAVWSAPVQAADGATVGRDGGYLAGRGGTQNVAVGVGKSYVVDLPRDAAEVLVADPKIANAVVRTARRAYIIGTSIGETDVLFFDAAGNQIAGLAVSVGRDLTTLRSDIGASVSGGRVSVKPVGEAVMLSGSVKSAAEAQTANDLAAKLVGDEKKVVNALAIEGREQVLLKVTIAEVQRNVVKQFGIDWTRQMDVAGAGLALASPTGFPINGSFLGSNASRLFRGGAGCTYQDKIGSADTLYNFYDPSKYKPLSGCNLVDSQIKALEQNGFLRTLASPTLTAISGESADFLAGGEFPVPSGQDNNGRVKIEFKRYGVSLTFTPVVLSEGRISMKLVTEVSELTNVGSFTLTTGSSSAPSLAVPGLSVRRATTTVEMPSGGSLAMAGILKDNVKQAMQGLPGIMKLPILGTLFRSRDYQSEQTELMILVTPYIAKSVQRKELARPDDGFAPPSDMDAVLLGKLNRIYGAAGPNQTPRPASYHGPRGYIVD